MLGVDGGRHLADRVPQILIAWRRIRMRGFGVGICAFVVDGCHDDIVADRKAIAAAQPVRLLQSTIGAVEERTIG